MLKKILSGGQTGADQAALDAAIKNNIPHGGAIPKGRMTENGVLPEKYNLEEMATKSYPKRTEKNVIDGDGTVIFSHGKLTGGSLLTQEKAVEHGKPVLHLDLISTDIGGAVRTLQQFIQDYNIEILNVAGPRASEDEKIYGTVFEMVNGLFLSKNMASVGLPDNRVD